LCLLVCFAEAGAGRRRAAAVDPRFHADNAPAACTDEQAITFRREESVLDVDFSESSSQPTALASHDHTDVRGLRSTPQSSGVNNATARFSLPDPTLAVRNLVRARPLSLLLLPLLRASCCCLQLLGTALAAGNAVHPVRSLPRLAIDV
jgi:hypothetical protein